MQQTSAEPPGDGRHAAAAWEDRFSWPDASAARRALRALRVESYREEIGKLARQVEPLAAAAPTVARLFLYEQLRALADAVTVRNESDGGGEDARLQSWMLALGADGSGEALIEAFRREVDRLLAPLSSPSRGVNPIVLRARRYIAENFREQISLSRVAAELGVARNYLSALFRRETGVTLTEYIHQLRIRKALVLLRSGQRSLSEVAFEVGYQSYRHFYRNFVRLVGRSPTLWLRDLDRSDERARLPAPEPDSSPGPAGRHEPVRSARPSAGG